MSTYLQKMMHIACLFTYGLRRHEPARDASDTAV